MGYEYKFHKKAILGQYPRLLFFLGVSVLIHLAVSQCFTIDKARTMTRTAVEIDIINPAPDMTPQPVSQIEPAAKAKPGPRPESKPKPEIKPEPGPGPKQEIKPKQKIKPNPEQRPESEPEAEPEIEPADEPPKPRTGHAQILSTAPPDSPAPGPDLQLHSETKHRVKTYYQRVREIIATNRYYPRRARSMEYEGTVAVSFTIGPDGSVTQIKITQSSGIHTLDRAARTTIKRCKFPCPPHKKAYPVSFPIIYILR